MRPSAYSIAERMRIVGMVERDGLAATQRRTGIWHSTLEYWRDQLRRNEVLGPSVMDVAARKYGGDK